MRRFWGLALALSFTGCSFKHTIGLDYDNMISTLPGDKNLEVSGYVHSEAWTPAFLYVFPVLPDQNSQRARDLAVEAARSLGADAITNVELHVETHMPFFWIAGWTEHHVTATAVNHKPTSAK